MMDTMRRLDAKVARFEGWLVVGVLILMVLVAGFAASVRNLTRFDIAWASALLNDIEWADSLLRKATLWLAFLGASLATHKKQHILIDPLLRVAPPRVKYSMLAAASLIAAVLTAGICYSFSSAVYLNLTERPVEYELLGPDGESMHVCDATPEQLKDLTDIDNPWIFCKFRTVLGWLHVPAETPGAAFQLIVPLAFFMISLRMLGHGIGYIGVLAGGDAAIASAEEAERLATEAQQASLHATDDEPDKS
jgi:TRAP-type C4-dicarboxylate transport system permease small subunit